MSDEGDVAQDYADRHNQDAIRRVLAGARLPVGHSFEVCEDCGETIPDARRRAVPGCTRCVECETVNERLREGL